MIYALLHQDVAHADRSAMARAILNRDATTLQTHVSRGDIVHVMDRTAASEFFCIYCLNSIFPTDARPPGGQRAQNPWHFEHARVGFKPGECVGKVRRPPIPHAISVLNPDEQGCYIALGCETTAGGQRTNWNRTRCKTIESGRTYCHLGAGKLPPCV